MENEQNGGEPFPNQLHFRAAVQQESQEIFKIFSDAITHMNELGIDQWDSIYPDQLTIHNDIQCRTMYLLSQKDSIISVIVLNEEQSPEYKTVCWQHRGRKVAVIHRLCVKPTEQGNGFGRKTILLAEKELLKQGYDCARLDAFSQNPVATKLYESLGYEKVGEVSFRKGIFNCYEKLLSDQSES